MEGYQTLRQNNVHVRLGQALAINAALPASDLKENVTVTARAPVVSVVSNRVSRNFDQHYFEKQPLPNNFYNIVKAAPGVNIDYTGSSGSAMLAYGGTSESQNAFTLDGINVADTGGGGHWVLPSAKWMDEIEVGGLGADAEYGGYTGGVINAVTKSGGNEFHGEVEYLTQPSSWVGNNDSTHPRQDFKFNDVSITAGGPIVKDKLWFFGSGEYWRQETTPLGAVDTSDRKIPRFFGKLTWMANNTNRVTFLAEYDNTTNERRGISESVLPDATSRQRAPGMTLAAHLESFIDANNFLNFKITGYDGRDDYLPYHGDDTPGRVDEDSGNSWQNLDIRELNHRHLVTLDGAWTHFANGLLAADDSHSFKFGAQYERGYSSDDWTRNGGFTYYDDSSQCESYEEYLRNPACGAYYVERGYGEYHESPHYSSVALYAQDSWRIGRFTFNPGLRYGHHKAGWASDQGNTDVYDASFLDPRFGAIWDVMGDARTAVKFHWGRYHDKMYTYLFDREASGHAVVPDQDCYWNSDTGRYDLCDEPTSISARMGKIDHPYVDEALLTFERQLSKDMIVGLDLIDRKFHNIMAMVNENQDYTLITAINNPLTGGTLPIYNLNSAPDFVLTTDNGAHRDFRSAVLRFEKRFSHGWQLTSSLVWTDLDGNILKNNGYANEFRDLNGLTNAEGRMDYAFSKWEYKLGGVVALPYHFQLSGSYTYLSGWYWTPYVRVYGLDYNSSIGRDINLVPRGSEQLPDRQLLDLRLEWSTPLRGGVRMTASLECFNALNKGTVLDIYNRWGSYDIETGEWSKRRNYGTTYQIEDPRQLRAGLRFSF